MVDVQTREVLGGDADVFVLTEKIYDSGKKTT
jgi:hypothetical protein